MKDELEPFCFWCGGNARFEFYTMPRSFHTEKQVLCDSCIALRGDNVAVFEMVEYNPGCGNPTMKNGTVFYTGRWVAVDMEKIKQLFPPEARASIVNTRIVGLRQDEYARYGFAKYPWRTIQ